MTVTSSSLLQDSVHLVRRGQTQAIRYWRRLPLMDRWLTGELLGPLIFGVAAFTAVTLSVGVLFELVRKVAEAGLPMAVAIQVLFLRLPGFLVLSFFINPIGVSGASAGVLVQRCPNARVVLLIDGGLY